MSTDERAAAFDAPALAVFRGQVGISDTREFLDELYLLEAEKADRKAAGLIVRRVTHLLNRKLWDVCDEVLRTADIRRISPAAMISFLGTTLPAKDHLPSRAAFVRKVETALTESEGEYEAGRILSRYR